MKINITYTSMKDNEKHFPFRKGIEIKPKNLLNTGTDVNYFRDMGTDLTWVVVKFIERIYEP